MTTPSDIIACVEDQADKADKIHGEDFEACMKVAAQQFGIPLDDVRDIMRDYLTGTMRAG